ncbi:phosphatase PAP2 family protein [Dethiothermospora halolimnae]|uniref:phosphatase PAP2 family protein n=1 Tax=Dethiothermospora halolimnae TaxID=3114390 RepID=UPI003CCBBA42
MQLDFLLFLQEISNPILDKIFIFITNLGSEVFYVLIMTLVFWCINKKLGIRLFVVTMISAYVNSGLKDLFQTQRPIYNEKISSLYTKSAPGYSFPSGHTQMSSTFWLYLMYQVKNKALYIIGWLTIVLVAFSRLYLRVHWPVDILGGFIIAIFVAFISDFIIRKVSTMKLNYIFTIILAIIIPNILLMVYYDENTIKLLPLMMGALIGYVIEDNHIRFNERAKLSSQIAKYMVGIVGFLILQVGLKYIFPLGTMYIYIRYLILGIWVTLVAPYLFKKLKLS